MGVVTKVNTIPTGTLVSDPMLLMTDLCRRWGPICIGTTWSSYGASPSKPSALVVPLSPPHTPLRAAGRRNPVLEVHVLRPSMLICTQASENCKFSDHQ
jgi:hypothetical protein